MMREQQAKRIGLAALIGVLVPLAAAQPLPARPTDYVVDLAGVIDRATYQELNGYLHDLEQKTGAQMVVLTLKTTGGEPIESYAVKAFERWQLGQKGRDNGVLIAIAIQDRRAKIEVGYGLEDTLTDRFTGQVSREAFAPYFKKGAYGRGIYEGTLVLANRVASSAGVAIIGMPVRTLPASPRGPGAFVCLFVSVLLLLVVLSSLFGRRYARYGRRHSHDGLWLWLLLGALSGSRHGHRNWGSGGWGGGFGRGGFGGFGGFGGGSFGGGGGGRSGGGGASFGW